MPRVFTRAYGTTSGSRCVRHLFHKNAWSIQVDVFLITEIVE